MNEDRPTLSLRERDRRWGLVRGMMRENDLDCLVLAGLSGREAYEGYLTNDTASGIVVFPLEGDPIYLVWSSTRVFKNMQGSLTGGASWIENWQENWRVGATGPGLVAALQGKGFDSATIGVVGIEAAAPQQLEGYIPYKTWTYVLNHLPGARFVEVSRAFAELMLVKSGEELAVVRHGAMIGERACEALLQASRPGASEAEIAAAVIKEIVGRGAGTRGASFILQTGAENLSWGPPAWMYEARAPRRVQEGDLVMAEVFQVYGGLETQEQMCVSLRPVHAVNQECAAVARRAYEVGLRELRPGKRFLEVAEAMEVPIAEAGCWHLTPLIHSINPLVWIGPTNVGIQQLPGIENYRGITRPYYPTDDFTIKSGMVFELEPNACIGQHRVNIGGTVIVTEDGVEELNSISTEMRIAD